MVAADVGFAEASWIMGVKSLVIFAVILGIVPMILLLERKLLGRFQARYGPNRVGPKGLLQPLADVVKLLSKEAYKPEAAVPVLWAIAPALVILSATATLAMAAANPAYASSGAQLASLQTTLPTLLPPLPSGALLDTRA